MIKTNLNFEKYLTMQKLTFSQRDALTKFRCGSNKLLVNKYSFSNDTEDKMCPICDLREVGDEFHYIFICPYLQKEREQYIKKYYRIRPNALKFSELFNSKSIKTLVNLAKFCKFIMDFFDAWTKT